MKEIKIGHWRLFFISMAVIFLLAVMFSHSIVALAFLTSVIGLYLAFELFVIFNIVYGISQFINQQIMAQQQMQKVQNKLTGNSEGLKIEKP